MLTTGGGSPGSRAGNGPNGGSGGRGIPLGIVGGGGIGTGVVVAWVGAAKPGTTPSTAIGREAGNWRRLRGGSEGGKDRLLQLWGLANVS